MGATTLSDWCSPLFFCLFGRTGEAADIDRPKHTEESTSVLRILSKVFVDHLERWLEHSVENWSNLGVETRL
jgi:hypothetical protein